MKKPASQKRKGRKSNKTNGTLERHFQILFKRHQSSCSLSLSSISSQFQTLLSSNETSQTIQSCSLESRIDDVEDDGNNCILSQEFFCTPDYITPENQVLSTFAKKDDVACPESPNKLNTSKSKRRRQDPLSCALSEQPEILDFGRDEREDGEVQRIAIRNGDCRGYVSQSAVALRCRVLPPPCIKNPYLIDDTNLFVDPFNSQRSKCAGYLSSTTGKDGLSRYQTDFHEIQLIGVGNFNRVFKALKRIEGCLYAIKRSSKKLLQDTERKRALNEIQVMAVLGCHENVVRYYSSWFESDHLYIQLELCDRSLSVSQTSISLTEAEVLELLYQMTKALHFMHQRGIAHLDVKPDNIYTKAGLYKLGDFGCATLLDQSLPIEEGDARYLPQEVLNENYDNLDKADIFSLGASAYELVRGSPLPESGSLFFQNLREGKLPLLPGHSLQFQNLLKTMVEPDPTHRPSAYDLMKNPIFNRIRSLSL